MLPVLGAGWSDPEARVVWGVGAESWLFLPLTGAIRRRCRLRLDLVAHLRGQALARQRLSVQANGQDLLDTVLTQRENRIELDIPARLLARRPVLCVRLAHPDHARPADLTGSRSTDMRALAVGCRGLALEEVADPLCGPAAQGPLHILTHHKCASSWLADYMRQVAALNGLRIFVSNRSAVVPPAGADIVVLINGDYAFLKDRIVGGIHVVRNPLALLASAYYSHLATHPLQGWPELVVQRAALQMVGREEGMLLTLAFLERHAFGAGAVGPFHALRVWDYADTRFVNMRMEDVVAAPAQTLGAAAAGHFGGGLVLPDDAAFSFERFAGGRRPGEIDAGSHYRAGSGDAWRRELPAAAVAYVRAHQAGVISALYPELAV
jgi:hypothetical protein